MLDRVNRVGQIVALARSQSRDLNLARIRGLNLAKSQDLLHLNLSQKESQKMTLRKCLSLAQNTTLRITPKRIPKSQTNLMSGSQQGSVEQDDEVHCSKEEKLKRVRESWITFVQVVL